MSSVLHFHKRHLVVADDIMTKTIEQASKAARSDAAVLLCGESGTGKELVARYIHEKSDRASGPFVSVNCAAIPEGLIEAEFFGFERGAFTGAIAQRIGKFERAQGGTLLLDEISEMPVTLQAKLLRVIQEGEIDRLGGRDAVAIDCRIIATTNREPVGLIRAGRFREDLYYRLNVVRIDCSPLRGRADAILSLADEFLRQATSRGGNSAQRFSRDAKDRLRSHAWPGNIRELQNAVQRAVLACEGTVIEVEHLSCLSEIGSSEEPVQSLADLEQQHILKILSEVGGNRNRAADRLGITSRTLRTKLKLYGEK